jgi:hypothetical protein
MIRRFFPFIGLCATVAGASVLVGCSDGADTAPAAVAVDGGVDVGATQRVIGRFRNWFFTGWDTIELGISLLGPQVTVWSPRTDGGFDRHEGLADARGDFEIAGVPLRPFWLELDRDFLPGTPDRPFNLLVPKLGFPEQRQVTKGTVLELALTDLAPWYPEDDLYLFSAAAGMDVHFITRAADQDPAPGATKFEDRFDLTRKLPGMVLIDGLVRGDELYVVQMRSSYSDGLTVRTADRVLRTSRLQMEAGAVTRLSGSMMTELPRQKVEVQWNPDALTTRALSGVGALDRGGKHLTVSASPVSLVGLAKRGALLATATGPPESVVPVTFDYVDPFPASWLGTVEYRVDFRVNFPVTSDVDRADYQGSIGGAVPLQPVVTTDLQVGPPEAVQVEGHPPLLPARGVGTTPRLTWQRPAGVEPTVYILTVYSLTEATPGSERALTVRGRVHTTAEEVRLPPGLVTPGQWGVVVVRAVSNPWYEMSPFFTSNKSSYAEAISGAFFP